MKGLLISVAYLVGFCLTVTGLLNFEGMMVVTGLALFGIAGWLAEVTKAELLQ